MSAMTNEERMRQLRERWARQSAERRKPGGEFKALVKSPAHQSRSGVREYAEKIISPAMMQIGERYFWQKRGYEAPPVTAGGVVA